MNIRKSTFFLITILTVGLLYFIELTRRLDGDLFVVATNYGLLACLMVLGNARYKRLVNPVILLAPMMLAFNYYGLKISNIQDSLDTIVMVSYYIFVLAFFIGCMIPLNPKISKNFDSPMYRLRVNDFLLFMASLVMVAEAILFGAFPLVEMIIHQVNTYGDQKSIPVAHYFVMLAAFLPALYYYSYKEGLISRSRLIICSLLSAFILLNTLSRQVMILGLISYYFSYVKINNVKEVRLFVFMIGLCIIVFLGIGELRIGSDNSSISSLDYLKIYSEVPIGLPVNVLEITFNLYGPMNFNTFNNIIRSTSDFYFGGYTLRPFLDVTRVNEVFGSGIPESRDTFKRLATIIADPYLDFGIFGVFIFSLSYGMLGSYAFSAYTARKNAAFSLMWSTFSYVMAMAIFANFFNVLFVWLCFFLCWILHVQPGRKLIQMQFST